MALLEGVPIYGVDVHGKTLTAVGAALLTSLATEFGPCPSIRLERAAYGVGHEEFDDVPNLLRLLVGELGVSRAHVCAERLWILEANLDDMNPEWFGPLSQTLLNEGALDVWLTPIQMKKGRPGTLLSVLAMSENVPELRARIFAETTTLGVREWEVARWPLPRRMETVQTPFGEIRVKLAEYAPGQWKASPEHEDCLRAARAAGVSVREVYQRALAAALELV